MIVVERRGKYIIYDKSGKVVIITREKRIAIALMGMLIYPFIILLASVLGFDKAASLITDIASVYVIAASGVVAAFMGFNAYSAKAESKKTSIQMEDS